MRWMQKYSRKHSDDNKFFNGIESTKSLSPNEPNEELSTDIKINEKMLRETFQECSDVLFRPIQICGETNILLIYIDGMSDTKTLDEVFLKPIMFDGLPNGLGKAPALKQMIEQQFVAIAQTQTVSTFNDVADGS